MARNPMLIERDGPSTLPRKAYVKKVGLVDVVEYKANGYFWVIDRRDERRLIHRDRLKFRRLPKAGEQS